MSNLDYITPEVGGKYYILCRNFEKGPHLVKLHCENVLLSRYEDSRLAVFAFYFKGQWNYKCQLTPVPTYQKDGKTVIMG